MTAQQYTFISGFIAGMISGILMAVVAYGGVAP